MNLKGKTILVTGGSLGIGKSIAKHAVNKGSEVIITGRDAVRLEKAAKETGAIPFLSDVSQENSAQETFDFVMQTSGKLDVLINNAGIFKPAAIDELSREKFLSVFDVNVFGVAILTSAFANYFKEKKEGSIINIASTAALRGYSSGSIYVASKFALRGLTECWRAELRPYNIRVMLINPSEVATAFGNPNRIERDATDKKLRPDEIAHIVISILEMDNRGFVPELSVWATNPF